MEVTSKRCGKCKVTKDAGEFTKLASAVTGLSVYCKGCKNAQVRERYVRDPEGMRRVHRRYYEKSRDRLREYKRQYKLKNPQKVNARFLVHYAVKTGVLTKGLCETCGSEKVQAHHTDYAKPLEVRWLCALHHSRETFGLAA